MRVSVVIPARCDAATLRRLRLHLDAQALDRDAFEVIVVDDGSDPPLEEASLRIPPSGAYAARNAGIERARGEVLAFTDTDCAPDAGWLQAGLTAIESTPRVAGCVELVTSPHPSLVERLDQARFLRQERYVAEGFGATANLFVRREVFDAVGLFDARLISGGDAEHGRRAAAFPIAYAPEAIVRHPCRSSARALLSKAHRVGFGFGQSVRLFGMERREASDRARDRLSTGGSALLSAGMIALHGATLVGAVRGYLAGDPRD